MHNHFASEPDMEWLIVDSTVCRAHPCAVGASKKTVVLKTKRQVALKAASVQKSTPQLTDWVILFRIHLTPGQRHDIIEAEALIVGYNCEYVIGDKEYNSHDFIDAIEANGATAVIPSRRNRDSQRTYDKHLYKERHLVECFFNQIKWYRRIFSRFEKRAVRYFGFLSFVSTLIWLR